MPKEKMTKTMRRRQACRELAEWLLDHGYKAAGETAGQPTGVVRIPSNRFVPAKISGQRKRFDPNGTCTVWVTVGLRTTCFYRKPVREYGETVKDAGIVANYDTLYDLETIKEAILSHQEFD